MLKLIKNNIRKKTTLYKEWKDQSKYVANWFSLYIQCSSLTLDVISKIFRRFLLIKDITIRVRFINGLIMYFPYDRANELTSFIYIYKNYIDNLESFFPGTTNSINGKVLDFGAHVGAFGITAAWVNPNWNVELYEASPDNFQVLLKTLRENTRLSANLSIRHVAVGSQTGVHTFKRGRTSTIGSMESAGFGAVAQHGLTLVNSQNINEILNQYQEVALIKCDVEGGEYDIFFSISETNWSKINRLILEAHPTTNNQPSSIIKVLKERGFQITTVEHKNLCVDIYASHA